MPVRHSHILLQFRFLKPRNFVPFRMGFQKTELNKIRPTIFYAFLLFFRLLIYCDVSEKNKILRQELTKLKVKSEDKEA